MKLTPELEVYRRSNTAIAQVFSRRFKILRRAYRMSLDDVAETLGISRQSIIYYAMGDRLPRIPILIALAKIFGKSTDYLLGLKNDNMFTLPCEVGSTVYLINSVKSGKDCRKTILSGKIDRFIIGGLGIPLADICTDNNDWYYACAYPNDYFLSKQEAQEAIKQSPLGNRKENTYE